MKKRSPILASKKQLGRQVAWYTMIYIISFTFNGFLLGVSETFLQANPILELLSLQYEGEDGVMLLEEAYRAGRLTYEEYLNNTDPARGRYVKQLFDRGDIPNALNETELAEWNTQKFMATYAAKGEPGETWNWQSTKAKQLATFKEKYLKGFFDKREAEVNEAARMIFDLAIVGFCPQFGLYMIVAGLVFYFRNTRTMRMRGINFLTLSIGSSMICSVICIFNIALFCRIFYLDAVTLQITMWLTSCLSYIFLVMSLGSYTMRSRVIAKIFSMKKLRVKQVSFWIPLFPIYVVLSLLNLIPISIAIWRDGRAGPPTWDYTLIVSVSTTLVCFVLSSYYAYQGRMAFQEYNDLLPLIFINLGGVPMGLALFFIKCFNVSSIASTVGVMYQCMAITSFFMMGMLLPVVIKAWLYDKNGKNGKDNPFAIGFLTIFGLDTYEKRNSTSAQRSGRSKDRRSSARQTSTRRTGQKSTLGASSPRNPRSPSSRMGDMQDVQSRVE